jgi:hypothetical protein
MITNCFEIEVQMQDDFSQAQISVAVDKKPTNPEEERQLYAAVMVLAENMMTMFASQSDLGFEKALETLCEGARTAHILKMKGMTVQ